MKFLIKCGDVVGCSFEIEVEVIDDSGVEWMINGIGRVNRIEYILDLLGSSLCCCCGGLVFLGVGCIVQGDDDGFFVFVLVGFDVFFGVKCVSDEQYKMYFVLMIYI